MLPSLSSLRIDERVGVGIPYTDLKGLQKEAWDVLVAKDDFKLLDELSQLKKMMMLVDSLSDRKKKQAAIFKLNRLKTKLYSKYGYVQAEYIVEYFVQNDFELLTDIITRKTLKELSTYLKAVNPCDGTTTYIPLEFDPATGMVGINLQQRMDFERIHLGHANVAFHHEAETLEDWTNHPDGVEEVLGSDSIHTYLGAYGPYLYHIPSASACPVPIYKSLYYGDSEEFNIVADRPELRTLWTEEGAVDPTSSSNRFRFSAYHKNGIEDIKFENGAMASKTIDEWEQLTDVNPQVLNPVFWFEQSEGTHRMQTEDGPKDVYIIQNVGLIYFAIPIQVLKTYLHNEANHQKKRTRHQYWYR